MYQSFALRQSGEPMSGVDELAIYEEQQQQGNPSLFSQSSDHMIQESKKSNGISSQPIIITKLSSSHTNQPNLSVPPTKSVVLPAKKISCGIKVSFVAVITFLLFATTTVAMVLLLEEPMQRLLHSLGPAAVVEELEQRAAEINSSLPSASILDFAHQKTWGTYRPHLYFGLKAKHVHSPLFGLMWYKQPGNDTGSKRIQLRHWCQHQDPVIFLWHAHDGRSFGIQNIEDEGLKFTTEWFNTPANSCLANIALGGGQEGTRTTDTYGFVFYFAIPGNSSRGKMIPTYHLHNTNLKVLEWLSPDFGQLSLELAVEDTENSSNPRFSYLYSRQEPSVDLTGLDQMVLAALGPNGPDNMLELQDTGLSIQSPNFAAVHLVVQAPALNSANIEIRIRAGDEQLPINFAQEIEQKRQVFKQHFDHSFPSAQLVAELMEPQREAAQYAVSNLLGGIGYWHGSTPVRNETGFVREYGPLSIMSAVPSRPWFPRPFLWDEGFHQLIVKQIDPELSMEIIGAWLDTMDEHGWIPREQALDPEALTYMPADFIFEPNVANPPMFIYLIGKFMDDPEAGAKFGGRLRQLYPRLKQLYLWLRTTQSGPGLGKMRWRGRNTTTTRELNPETLPSGFDDYPRASHPTNDESHLDLRCWMAHSAKVLHRLAIFVKDKNWVPEIKKDVKVFNEVDTLDQGHWSEQARQYCDYGLHSTNVSMVEQVLPDGTRGMVRQVLAEPKLGLVEDVNGYGNLFPFLLQILPPESEKLVIMLKNINDTETFWTPYGLRSMSSKSRYYNTWNNELKFPYWRGAIWINMNFLALEALHNYSKTSVLFGGVCREMYVALRHNLVTNIVTQYQQTGYFWEHYNDQTGVGQGTRPFTGWTALFALIFSEQYE